MPARSTASPNTVEAFAPSPRSASVARQRGVVEGDSERSLWLPYVEVADVADATERARQLGASVLLDPREGPMGWRSVVEAPAGAEIALWQPKT
jgi:predicted enzyme related to lactoylglutathione lyase